MLKLQVHNFKMFTKGKCKDVLRIGEIEHIRKEGFGKGVKLQIQKTNARNIRLRFNCDVQMDWVSRA